MSYNAKNYTEQGGDVTHIGGKLVIEEGATVEGTEIPNSYVLPEASAEEIGGVKLVANQPASEATELADLVTAHNALLAALKAAGVMAADATESAGA